MISEEEDQLRSIDQLRAYQFKDDQLRKQDQLRTNADQLRGVQLRKYKQEYYSRTPQTAQSCLVQNNEETKQHRGLNWSSTVQIAAEQIKQLRAVQGRTKQIRAVQRRSKQIRALQRRSKQIRVIQRRSKQLRAPRSILELYEAD
ncbi:hypothetical protein F511_13759 [Dorcoceras hygrometricum]|uniref:Uncharacterized protein n=1 Tax=Dorcoceras hygrometricum TaxID=472368 RepID=A0A2Z7CVC3_9LAMI|nr:hypothetical protein F511_13759 [Dorcoceras hygrometricum]